MLQEETDEKTEITFKQVTPTFVQILRGEKIVGQIYSQLNDGGTPYPHHKDKYCLNSIQVCGWDRMDGPWGCGPFRGHKDLVLHFRPIDDDYYKERGVAYGKYVKQYLDSGKDPRELQSFEDWVQTFGAY